MKNLSVATIIDECNSELNRIGHLIEGLGTTNQVSGFLTKYALMKVCSTLERAYKTVIADYYKAFSNELEHYIDHNVHNANMNACYNNINKMLCGFDENKSADFKNRVNSLTNGIHYIESFNNLNQIRNNVVHGGTNIPSYNDIKTKFEHSIIIIDILDSVMS